MLLCFVEPALSPALYLIIFSIIFHICRSRINNNGLQPGVFSYTYIMNGIQIGFINTSKRKRGVQPGVVNKNEKRTVPLINRNFN